MRDASESKEISINLNEEAFAELILDFLGKKEKIKYSKPTTFQIRPNDIEQFYYLLNEKISKEQYTHINNFTLDIYYNDNTSRLLSGIDQLNKFTETRDVYPTSITLEWNIILKFPNNRTVENQKLEASFYIFKDKKRNSDGYVLINVEHTNQAWAIEVLNLLKSHTDSFINEQSKEAVYYKKTRKNISYKSLVAISLAVLYFSLLLVGSNPINYNSSNSSFKYSLLENLIKIDKINETEIAVFAIKNLGIEEIRKTREKYISDKNIKNILNKGIEIRNEKFNQFWFTCLIFVLSIIIIIYILIKYVEKGISYYELKSFILLTKREEKRYEEYLKEKKRIEFYSISFLFFTITTGIIVNFIFQFIIS